MARRMASAAYRNDQWKHRFDEHVAPLNHLVDALDQQNNTGRPPYIAPMYRGIRARGLAILRDPGPKAGGAQGSGFLSVENDDPTAERQCNFMREAGIDPAEIVPWNAYPWYINAAPTPTQMCAGIDPLRRIIELLPDLRAVLLLGRDAQRAWRHFVRTYPGVSARRGLQVFPTYHPGRQALWHKDPEVRAAREAAIRTTFAQAAGVIDRA